MEYIVYLYDLENNVVWQITEILDVQIEIKLSDIWTAEFTIDNKNEFCKKSFLKWYRRVKINLLNNNEEKTLFDGVIRWLVPWFIQTRVILNSFEYYLEKRKIRNDINFTNETINNILNDVLDDLNIIYNTGITINCWITDTYSPTYKKWQDFLSIIKDLAKNWYEFKIENKVLYFKDYIGENRTTWPNFLQYRKDINEPSDSNISNLDLSINFDLLANWVISKSGDNYSINEDSTSITEFWLIEETITVFGDDESSGLDYLENHKNGSFEYWINIISNDFFECNLWDFVSVYINSWNDLLEYEWEMRVLAKRFLGWDLKKIEIFLGINNVKTSDIIWKINEIEKRINNLEIL